jgi:hypothetical protein
MSSGASRRAVLDEPITRGHNNASIVPAPRRGR